MARHRAGEVDGNPVQRGIARHGWAQPPSQRPSHSASSSPQPWPVALQGPFECVRLPPCWALTNAPCLGERERDARPDRPSQIQA